MIKNRSRQETEAFFTIVTPNYFGHAKALMDSVRRHNPSRSCFIVVLGKGLSSKDLKSKSVQVVEFDQWADQDLELKRMAFLHSPFELCCALKPYFAKALMESYSLKKLVYLDSDILVFNSFQFIFDLLDKHSIILTPHVLDPDKSLIDSQYPNEGSILMTGTYNAGFFAVNNSAEGLKFLNWWTERTFYQCEKSPHEGVWDDQKWLNLVPGLFSSCLTLRHWGCNVAFFNFHERHLQEINGRWHCNEGQPLIFFHYSGWSAQNPAVISRHQNRYSMHDSPVYKKIFFEYIVALKDNLQAQYQNLPYEYSAFENNLPIVPMIRKLYKMVEQRGATNFGDPFQVQGSNSFFEWLTNPGSENVCPLALEMRRGRPDVKKAYDYPASRLSNLKLQEWAANSGAIECELGPKWQKVMALSLARAKGRMQVESHHRYDSVRHIPSKDPVGFGVNLIGYANSEKGMGVSVRRSAECLQKAGIPFRIFPLKDTRSMNIYASHATSKDGSYLINLIHVNPEDLSNFIQTGGGAFLRGRLNIGYWTWEFPEFPKKYQKYFELFNEIWVPSKFVQDAISADSPIPVIRVPHPISDEWKKIEARPLTDKFTFLMSFDFDSIYERKNPEATISAFQKAFPSKENVRLVVKSARGSLHPEERGRLQEAISKDRRIEWIDNVLSDEKNKNLLAECHCYVSLHRSEGFGLSLIEAMSLAKPVIGTGYSGNVDFLSPQTGFPIQFDLKKTRKAYPPYDKGLTWAEPLVEDAAQRMRAVYDNHAGASAIAKAGQTSVFEHFSSAKISEIYARRLAAIRHMVPHNV